MCINEINEGGKYNFAKNSLFCPWSGIQFDKTFAIWVLSNRKEDVFTPR